MTLLSPHSLGDPEFAFINPSPPSLPLPPATPTAACLSVFRPLDFLVFPYSAFCLLIPPGSWRVPRIGEVLGRCGHETARRGHCFLSAGDSSGRV